jgi:hypothetical protein
VAVATVPRYVSLARFKAALQRTLPNTYDAALIEILVSTEAAVDHACNRTFDPAPPDPTEQRLDLPVSSIVYLPDVITITAVTVRETALTADDWELLPKVREGDWCRLQRLDGWGNPHSWASPGAWGMPYPWLAAHSGRRAGQLHITARWGFAETVPACVTAATLRGAITQYQQMPYLFVASAAAEDDGDVVGGGAPPAVQLTPAVLELLAPVTRPVLADVFA